PLSTALKCYLESSKDRALGRQEYDCLNSLAEYCMIAEGDGVKARSCDESAQLCQLIGETCEERNGAKICCC
ncbi:hypothetical protein PMAYCL1PPCAC_04150, partial [Pristionchus mayeri]